MAKRKTGSGLVAVAAWLSAFILSACPLAAQDWVTPGLDFTQRLDLRDLGYPLINEVPHNNTAITSLLTAADGKIYGATTGDTAYLFVFDPKINKVRHLGRVEGQESIHHALVQDSQGLVYLGTGLNPFTEFELSKGDLGDLVDKTLWKDIKDHYKDYAGGHLYCYDPSKSDSLVKLEGQPADLTDLGIPVPNNSVYCLAMDQSRQRIYGISYPDGKFFYYDIAGKTFHVVGDIDRKKVYHGPERYWRSLPRALYCDSAGRVFTSGPEGRLVYYCPDKDSLVVTKMQVPGNLYTGEDQSYAVAECFAAGCDGWVYGGGSDGHLFRFCPDKMKLDNLGKVRSTRRLRALVVAKDGRVYLTAGERTGAMPNRFYCYDPKEGAFTDLGMLIVDRSPYYYWRGYQFDAMASGTDGTLYIGESERAGHLFLYIP